MIFKFISVCTMTDKLGENLGSCEIDTSFVSYYDVKI